jgi:hypothetical protein
MDKHHDFTAWAVRNGLEINGIAPHKFPGRGLGIVAVQRHVVGLISHLYQTVDALHKTLHHIMN